MTKGHLMGDRAVLGIREKSSAPTLFLYNHWSGSEQDVMLAEALKVAKARIEMDDASYATRIIISQMTKGLEDSEIGAGLYIGGTQHGSDYHTINIVDLERKVVMNCLNDNSDKVEKEWAISDFIIEVDKLLANAL
jgi:hypothetical protein